MYASVFAARVATDVPVQDDPLIVTPETPITVITKPITDSVRLRLVFVGLLVDVNVTFYTDLPAFLVSVRCQHTSFRAVFVAISDRSCHMDGTPRTHLV